MAAVSARCLRSLSRISSTINKGVIKGAVNGATQARSLSSLTSGTLLRDSGLLRSIARDTMVKNLAKRHARLSAAVSVMAMAAPPVAIICDMDDESLEAHCSDEDETFSCDDDAIHGLY